MVKSPDRRGLHVVLILLAVSVLAGIGILLATNSNSASRDFLTIDRIPNDYDLSYLENRTFDMVNDVRYANNLGRLEFDYNAWRAAKMHSDDMAATGRFNHMGSDKSMAKDRMSSMNVSKTEFFGGENIAAISNSRTTLPYLDFNRKFPWIRVDKYPIPYDEMAELIVNGWLNSPGHRRAIFTPGYTKSAIGVSYGGDIFYFTEDFS
jgi:uncharacterized protein YkwD